MTTRRLIMSEWLYLMGIVLGAIGIIAGGFAYRQEQIDDAIQDALIRELLGKVIENRQVLDANRKTLQTLEQARTVGPRHTACDTKTILADLRAKGVDLPHYEVEDRCKQ